MRQTKTGILLANLGTPDAPTPEAVKRYLKQFLSDRRVVDTSRLLWWPLLRGVILPLRSPRVAKLYASVWMEDGSPLMVYSRQQQQALAQRLPEMPVALGMSYGSPSLESAVDELLAEHVDHIVVLPLYPQYSCSTVGAVWDELARILIVKDGNVRMMPVAAPANTTADRIVEMVPDTLDKLTAYLDSKKNA